MLCRAAMGISLMLSPHPSYPPLEMAEAGLITLTNSYDGKDLSLRSDNIVSIDVLTPATLAEEIGKAISRAEPMIGATTEFGKISVPPCAGAVYSVQAIACSLQVYLQ
jgi:hypothetical protein